MTDFCKEKLSESVFDKDLIWIAGALTVTGGLRCYGKHLVWTITNTEEKIIDEIRRAIGFGSKTGPEKGFKAPRFRLYIRDNQAEILFLSIKPYLPCFTIERIEAQVNLWKKLNENI